MKRTLICIFFTVLILLSGSLSATASTLYTKINNEVNVEGDCAVIVVGGFGQYEHIRSAKKAEAVYLKYGYNVKYLEAPTLTEVVDAIKNWVPENLGQGKKLSLVFIDHGGPLGFSIRNLKLTPNKLSNCVDSLNGKYSTCLIYIESCYAGVFVHKLSKTNRIIITTSDFGLSYYTEGDESCFSKVFFSELDQGASYGEAWMKADEYIDDEIVGEVSDQNPWIDDNGDGIAHGTDLPDTLPLNGDGNLALRTGPTMLSKNRYNENERSFNQYPIIKLFKNMIKNKLVSTN